MDAQDFSRFLAHRLCWLDGFPTHLSSALQRQCPHCRSKWSYQRWEVRWRLAEAWAVGLSRKHAAAQCGVDIHTAGKIFQQIEGRVSAEYLERIYFGDVGQSPEADVTAAVCQRLRRLSSKAAANREVAALALRNKPLEDRMEDIFQLWVSEDLRATTSRALARLTAWQKLCAGE